MKKISVKREAVNKALHKFSAECRKEGYKSESRWLICAPMGNLPQNGKKRNKGLWERKQ